MKIPTIKNTQKQDDKVELLLSFSKSAVYFQGHFPQIAILPGFMQIHFAMFFAKKYWLLGGEITNIKKLRFTKIITPNTDVSLMIEYLSPKKINFKYFSGDTSHSSGEIHFGEINNV
jgi:3-hydroxymyristoyl/3-hydroxydecanoyl-(acyl carrier protein) dehydratase